MMAPVIIRQVNTFQECSFVNDEKLCGFRNGIFCGFMLISDSLKSANLTSQDEWSWRTVRP